ncbi:MAG: hypothetical protein JWN38_1178 [Candidatus Saccharibacteria bacterium]|nr:hypothetical protein [Candidatus Saccharibacteria bacterium]
MKPTPKIALIGGGTGSYTLLQALKNYTPNISAIVNMADDGGSTGVLRDELGVLPPGDVRQCLVALSNASQELRDLFTFRFPTGSFEGHSFGNIFLSAVETMTSRFDDAVRMAGEVLNIQGRVLPITLDDCKLSLRLDGEDIHGQRAVELTAIPARSNPDLYLDTPATITADARQAILDADIVVIAPGNLYASLVPALIVDGVAEVLQQTAAPIVFVCNLVNKPNHTAGFAVHDYASEIERLTAAGIIDTVLYNTNLPTGPLLEKYALEHEYPVAIDEQALQQASYHAVGGDFLSTAPIARDPNDSFINRSLIRHDAEKVAQAILKTIPKN